MGAFAGGRPRGGAPANEARTRTRAVEQDHDLPLLDRESPSERLDWEPLLAEGIQPAMALGAERRRLGRR